MLEKVGFSADKIAYFRYIFKEGDCLFRPIRRDKVYEH